MIEVCHIDEPELEFGGGGRHLDIRFGLMDYGPFDLTHSEAPRRIRIGIVGSAATGEGVARWIERCCAGLPAKASRQPNLFPAFPGLGSDGAKGLSFSTMLGKISWVCPKGRRDFFASSNGDTDMGNSHGRFVWYELMTTDMKTAKLFYANVVGWGARAASAP